MGASLTMDVQTMSLNLNNNLHFDRNDNGREPADRLHPVDRPYIQQNFHHQGERGIDILHRSVVLEAIHDSAESFPQPKCHPETRKTMLEDLHQWAINTNSKTTILWLYGPAGAGKSAIMQTLARQLEVAGKLGGSFFFKRGHPTRGNGRALFATIAYQLALSVPWLRARISHIVEKDPSIVERTIETQMIKLVSEPCRSHRNGDHVTILVDGLDECERHDVQQEILHVIQELIPHIMSLPPSVELLLLICRVNPEHIFNLESSDLECMLFWLNQIPSTATDVIKLWEDYVFMFSFQEPDAQVETHSRILSDAEHIVSPSHKILQIIVAMVFLGIPFWRLPICTGITWDELGDIICSIRPIFSRYGQGPHLRILLPLFLPEAYSRAARDLALRFIPRMLENSLGAPTSMPLDVVNIWKQFPLLVRLSPPCPELYGELWSIPFPRSMWLDIAELIIYHVSKWLQSFPEPTLELIAFWKNGRTPAQDACAAGVAIAEHEQWEEDWRKKVGEHT
ncbi:hypothetical protein C8R45DRAFT_1014564 [Mycena sanguinolenta]|nr:hypothetical protein C8R45DRAFT_1014564 [Mycena sanguinolenta]